MIWFAKLSISFSRHQTVKARQPQSPKDPDLKPLWDFLDLAWGNQVLEEGGDDKNDELETPPAEECILAIEDGLTEEAKKGAEHEVSSTEQESKEKVEDSPTSPSQPESTLCASLKELSISGPDQDVRQRAKQIRAELIRPPGEGGEYTGASPKFSTEPTSFNRYSGEICVLNPLEARACSSPCQGRSLQTIRRKWYVKGVRVTKMPNISYWISSLDSCSSFPVFKNWFAPIDTAQNLPAHLGK